MSFPLSYHTSSGITQITFLNAPQNFPINRCNPSPETTISQVTTYQCFCSPQQKIYSFVYFPLQRCFSYSNVSIAVYTRTTSLCNLATKIQGSRARSDAYEQARRILTLLSRKRLKEQPNQPLFLMLSISLKFQCLRSASVGAKCPSFVVWFPITPFRIFIPQWNQVLLHPVRFDFSMVFVIV